MRRICCGSACERATRFAHPAAVSLLSMTVLLSTPGLAQAQPAPSPDGMAALIAAVADANQRLQDLGAEIQGEKEGVNKALVELQAARDDAAAAEQNVTASRQAIADADADIKGRAHDASYTLERLVLTVAGLRDARA